MADKEKVRALQYMTSVEGWVYLQQYIQSRIDDNMKKLLTCSGWDDVIKHRAKVEALNSVFIYINQTIEEGMNEDGSDR